MKNKLSIIIIQDEKDKSQYDFARFSSCPSCGGLTARGFSNLTHTEMGGGKSPPLFYFFKTSSREGRKSENRKNPLLINLTFIRQNLQWKI